MKTKINKRVFLLNPGMARAFLIRQNLIGGRLGCSEIEYDIARDIETVARNAMFMGTVCDLTEIFTRNPVRIGDRGQDTIRVENEVLVEELMNRVFEPVDETDEHIYIIVKSD